MKYIFLHISFEWMITLYRSLSSFSFLSWFSRLSLSAVSFFRRSRRLQQDRIGNEVIGRKCLKRRIQEDVVMINHTQMTLISQTAEACAYVWLNIVFVPIASTFSNVWNINRRAFCFILCEITQQLFIAWYICIIRNETVELCWAFTTSKLLFDLFPSAYFACRRVEWQTCCGSRRQTVISLSCHRRNGWLTLTCEHQALTNRAPFPFAGLSEWLPAGPPPADGRGLWPPSAFSSPPPSPLIAPVRSAADPEGRKADVCHYSTWQVLQPIEFVCFLFSFKWCSKLLLLNHIFVAGAWTDTLWAGHSNHQYILGHTWYSLTDGEVLMLLIQQL